VEDCKAAGCQGIHAVIVPSTLEPGKIVKLELLQRGETLELSVPAACVVQIDVVQLEGSGEKVAWCKHAAHLLKQMAEMLEVWAKDDVAMVKMVKGVQ